MTDYTPLTEDMRGCYVNHCQITHGLTETVAWAEFDRFLAQHDAEVKAEARTLVAELASRLYHVETHWVPEDRRVPTSTADVLREFDRIHPTTKES